MALFSSQTAMLPLRQRLCRSVKEDMRKTSLTTEIDFYGAAFLGQIGFEGLL